MTPPLLLRAHSAYQSCPRVSLGITPHSTPLDAAARQTGESGHEARWRLRATTPRRDIYQSSLIPRQVYAHREIQIAI